MRRGKRAAAERSLERVPDLIWLHTCTCAECRGKGAACMDAFEWLERTPDHALQHAQSDLIQYFDRLPPEVQDALNAASVNVCSWCAAIWVGSYGKATAVELINNTQFYDDTRAFTGLVLEVNAQGRDH